MQRWRQSAQTLWKSCQRHFTTVTMKPSIQTSTTPTQAITRQAAKPKEPKQDLRWFLTGLARSSTVVGVSMGVGDAACQRLSSWDKSSWEWDSKRSRDMWAVGTFSSGPLGHCWMVLLERLVPGSTLGAIVVKIVANASYAYVISLPLMFTLVTLLKPNTTLRDAQAKIKADLVPTFVAGSFYWPFVNFLTFKAVPLDYRAMVGSVFGVIWNVYLSSKANTHASAGAVV